MHRPLFVWRIGYYCGKSALSQNHTEKLASLRSGISIGFIVNVNLRSECEYW